MHHPPSGKVTLGQAVFLVVGVPLFLLASLEVGARALEYFWATKAPSTKSPNVLEMPTWMLKEANASARASVSKEDLEWLNLFQEGVGYRVRLIPHSTAQVKNTFSLIPADLKRRRTIVANSLGFRGPEVSPLKPPHTFRILIFGDSSSFGWGVEQEESWSSLLQQELQKRYPDTSIEVANFAIPGDSSAYGRLLFDTFAPEYQSDLIILGFGANDAKPVLTSHTDQVDRFRNNSTALTLRSWLRYSALFRGVERALAARPPASKKEVESLRAKPRIPAVTPIEYATNLAYMTERARELGNENTLILTLCTPTNYSREARLVARRLDALSFNGQGALLRLIPKVKKGYKYKEYVSAMEASYPSQLRHNERFYVTSDGCHPNELGHRFVADRLTQIIERAHLIPE